MTAVPDGVDAESIDLPDDGEADGDVLLPAVGEYAFTAAWDEIELTVKVIVVKIEIEGVEWTEEGLNSKICQDSNTVLEFSFKAVVQPDTVNVSEYIWTANWPENVGHEPEVNFEDSFTQKTNVVKAKWFADPDSNLLSETGHISEYKIFIAISVGGLQLKSDPHIWQVKVTIGGACIWPAFINEKSIVIEEVDGIFVVTEQGGFSRSEPRIIVEASQSSDFYNKVYVHEQTHVDQWQNQEPWKNLFDANKLYNSSLHGMESDCKQDLRDQISALVSQKHLDDMALAEQYECRQEQEAYAAEREEWPNYLELTVEEVLQIHPCFCGECP